MRPAACCGSQPFGRLPPREADNPTCTCSCLSIQFAIHQCTQTCPDQLQPHPTGTGVRTLATTSPRHSRLPGMQSVRRRTSSTLQHGSWPIMWQLHVCSPRRLVHCLQTQLAPTSPLQGSFSTTTRSPNLLELQWSPSPRAQKITMPLEWSLGCPATRRGTQSSRLSMASSSLPTFCQLSRTSPCLYRPPLLSPRLCNFAWPFTTL